MPWEYIVMPAVAMTILPRIASWLDKKRTIVYVEVNWPKMLAKFAYLFFSFAMLSIDWKLGVSFFFGFVVYLLNHQLGIITGRSRDENTNDVVGAMFAIPVLGLVSFAYCVFDSGFMALPLVIIPWGIFVFFKGFNRFCDPGAVPHMSMAEIHALDEESRRRKWFKKQMDELGWD